MAMVRRLGLNVQFMPPHQSSLPLHFKGEQLVRKMGQWYCHATSYKSVQVVCRLLCQVHSVELSVSLPHPISRGGDVVHEPTHQHEDSHLGRVEPSMKVLCCSLSAVELCFLDHSPPLISHPDKGLAVEGTVPSEGGLLVTEAFEVTQPHVQPVQVLSLIHI